MRSTSEAIDGLGEDGDSSSGPLLLLAAAALGLLAVSALMLVRLFATSGGVTVGLPQRMPFRAPAQPHPSGVTEESGAKAQPSGVTEGSGAQPQPSGVTEGSGAKAQPSEGTDGSDATARPQPSVAAKGPVAPAQMQASRPPVAPAPAHPQQSVVRNGSVATLGTAVASAHRGREARKEPLMDGVRALGYVSVFENESFHDAHVKSQMEEIDSLCERRGWRLVELVRDKEAPSGKALDRPGLGYALERMQAGEASCLIVSKLRRLSHSVADIGRILDVIRRAGGRLVALDLGIDTATPEGRKAANVLLAVSDWERQRLAERTRQGLEATRAKGGAVGRPSVHDVPELKQRIVELRESGLTLQAIADRLNAEGVPTLRGGQMWRPSAVQAAAGYRRPARGTGRFETEESRNARSAE
jgi:DNA invertase Pin-like site-specific DNA recombinase